MASAIRAAYPALLSGARRLGEPSLDKLAAFCKKGADPVIMDLKGMFEPGMAVKQGIRYWRL